MLGRRVARLLGGREREREIGRREASEVLVPGPLARPLPSRTGLSHHHVLVNFFRSTEHLGSPHTCSVSRTDCSCEFIAVWCYMHYKVALEATSRRF